MELLDFTAEEIFSAYKKVKHYFYYDNTSLFIREKIAFFEASIEKEMGDGSFMDALWRKFEAISENINGKNLRWWRTFLKRNIDIKTTPKSFRKPSPKILTNKKELSDHKISRLNIYIDASVEVHIIAVLWLSTVGKELAETIDKDNYAYKLVLTNDESKLVGGLRIYKPYFIQYQNWRDRAIEKAEQLLAEEKDVVILSLDVKDYFHSVKIDLEQVKTDFYKRKPASLDPKAERLFDLLGIIHEIYTSKVSRVKSISHDGHILPIGLLSSGLLGNYYLKTFDSKIKEALNPSYYGRYVDDILLVLTNVTVSDNAISPVNDFISRYLVSRKVLQYDNIADLPEYLVEVVSYSSGKSRYRYKEIKGKNKNEEDLERKQKEAEKLRFSIRGAEGLIIQSEKVILQSFDHLESPAIINKFKKNIEKNRSEFRYLPDEDKVDTEFDEEAFSLYYSDSVNKLRSIKEFSEDKYGASKYLASKIFATSMGNEPIDEQTTKQILTFFKGVITLSFHSLWEKVATYFVINNDPEALVTFYRQAIKAIDNITFEHFEERKTARTKNIVREDLKQYLKIAVATPLSFNPNFAKELHSRYISKDHLQEISQIARTIRHANMFRHAWVGLPAINFTRYVFHNDSTTNLLTISDDDIITNGHSASTEKGLQDEKFTILQIDERLKFLSPRYVHFHELNLLQIFEIVHSISNYDESSVSMINAIPKTAFREYWKINQEWKIFKKQEIDLEARIESSRKTYFQISNSGDEVLKENDLKEGGCFVKVLSDSNRSHAGRSKNSINKKIALANIKVSEENIKSSYLGNSNRSKTRRQQLFKLINEVEKERCDLLVLPEVSVPYHWISLLTYQASRRHIAIVAGLEHWVNKSKFAFNFIVTLLPIQKEDYTTCLIRVRLKNHYSPEEKRQLNGYSLLIPGETVKKQPKRYDLFHWNNTYFSVYNCFELADINDRALFKAKVDFIVASEYNRDTSYFSEIAGSWVRDLHCFFIQVNSSNFGDSKVVQPSSNETKSVLHIKGGDNSTIVVGRLPITELRAFQEKEYELQKDDKSFKPTPPDFNRKYLEIRMKNKSFGEES